MSLFGKTYEIKDTDGKTLFKSNKVDSLKECVELAVKNDVKLQKANLSGADLSGADLERADFFEANLKGANLLLANLTKANLKDANIEWSILRMANLTEANIEGANFCKTLLKKTTLNNAKMAGTNFSDAKFSSDKIKQDCIRKSQEGKNLADSKAKKEANDELVKDAQDMIKAAMMSGNSR